MIDNKHAPFLWCHKNHGKLMLTHMGRLYYIEVVSVRRGLRRYQDSNRERKGPLMMIIKMLYPDGDYVMRRLKWNGLESMVPLFRKDRIRYLQMRKGLKKLIQSGSRTVLDIT